MLNRRAFLATTAAAALPAFAKSTTKRDRMLAWVAGKPTPGYTPAAFFLHWRRSSKTARRLRRSTLSSFAKRTWTS